MVWGECQFPEGNLEIEWRVKSGEWSGGLGAI